MRKEGGTFPNQFVGREGRKQPVIRGSPQKRVTNGDRNFDLNNFRHNRRVKKKGKDREIPRGRRNKD
jgi:hypothetical protein